jgi:hypothetical protein
METLRSIFNFLDTYGLYVFIAVVVVVVYLLPDRKYNPNEKEKK